MVMNNRGWIKIVEAFFAVLLVTGVLLIVINKGYVGGDNNKEKIEGDLLSILREIELNDALRLDVLGRSGMLIEGQTFAKVNERLPDYLDCSIKICELRSICELAPLDTDPASEGKAIYVRNVAIAAHPDQEEEFAPKQLKLFCWTK
jgi:hypothetical protein